MSEEMVDPQTMSPTYFPFSDTSEWVKLRNLCSVNTVLIMYITVHIQYLLCSFNSNNFFIKLFLYHFGLVTMYMYMYMYM